MSSGSGTLTGYIDQLDQKALTSDALLNSGDLNVGHLGTFLKQGSGTDVGIITGSALQVFGSTIQTIAQTHQVSILAKQRVQCMSLQVAEKGITATEDSFKALIAMYRDQVQLQERIRKSIVEIDERHRADIEKYYEEITRIIVREDFDRVGTILLGGNDKRLAALERGNDVTQASLKALAESTKIDPEIIKRCADQTHKIIQEIGLTVRALVGQDEAKLTALTTQALSNIQEHVKKNQDLSILEGIDGAKSSPTQGEEID